MNAVRTKIVSALVINIVFLIGTRGPWFTSGDVNRGVWFLFSVALPSVALVLGLTAVIQLRRSNETTNRAELILAWISLLLPAAWLASRLLFLLGELFIGHN